MYIYNLFSVNILRIEICDTTPKINFTVHQLFLPFQTLYFISPLALEVLFINHYVKFISLFSCKSHSLNIISYLAEERVKLSLLKLRKDILHEANHHNNLNYHHKSGSSFPFLFFFFLPRILTAEN